MSSQSFLLSQFSLAHFCHVIDAAGFPRATTQDTSVRSLATTSIICFSSEEVVDDVLEEEEEETDEEREADTGSMITGDVGATEWRKTRPSLGHYLRLTRLTNE